MLSRHCARILTLLDGHVLDARLKRFGQLDDQVHALLATHRIRSGEDHRILRVDQQLCDFFNSARFGSRGRSQSEFRNVQFRTILSFRFLQVTVGDNQCRTVRDGHPDLVCADRGLAEVRQRLRCVVPLHVIAQHRAGVLCAVFPLDAGPPFIGSQCVAGEKVNRNAGDERVIDHHRRMLQSDGSVRSDGHRFPFDAEVTGRDADRGFFVIAHYPFGALVAAVVDK